MHTAVIVPRTERIAGFCCRQRLIVRRSQLHQRVDAPLTLVLRIQLVLVEGKMMKVGPSLRNLLASRSPPATPTINGVFPDLQPLPNIFRPSRLRLPG